MPKFDVEIPIPLSGINNSPIDFKIVAAGPIPKMSSGQSTLPASDFVMMVTVRGTEAPGPDQAIDRILAEIQGGATAKPSFEF